MSTSPMEVSDTTASSANVAVAQQGSNNNNKRKKQSTPTTTAVTKDTSSSLLLDNKPENGPVKIAALYKFVHVEDPSLLQSQLRELTGKYHILGMLIIAKEGLNGTIAASPSQMDQFLHELMTKDSRFTEGVEIKYSTNEKQPFYRMRISIRKEIVTLGIEDFTIKPSNKIFNIEPSQWNDIINREDMIVIDTRNDYEYELGTFQNAINPNTLTFREFPSYMEEQVLKKGDSSKPKKVAMFCTGGIRCEKVSSYLVEHSGVDEVYNLKGGILKYLEEIPSNESTWNGECFVFDQRVTVGHGLIPGDCQLCRGCRHPVTKEDREREDFVEGVSCRYCIDKLTEAKKKKAMQRDLQIKLANERQEKHLGYKHPGHELKKAQKKQQQQGGQMNEGDKPSQEEDQGDEKKQKVEHDV